MPLIAASVLFWSVIWAYVDYPRLQVDLGGFSDTIHLLKSEINIDELEKRLTSAEFMRALNAKDLQHPPFFQGIKPIVVRRIVMGGLDANPFIAELQIALTNVYKGQSLVFMIIERNISDLDVIYIFPRSYCVNQSTNSWILRLQAALPGMPDTTKLDAEAEAANLAVKNHIGKQLQLAIQDSASSSHN
jgi:hypothetical protein